MRENLFFKTDTLPEEIPLLFSNKNLYKNYDRNKLQIILDKEKPKKLIISGINTVPYFFYIPKIDGSTRKMSLLHPLAQIQMFGYILRYEQMISAFCQQSEYSVRSPIIRNSPVYSLNKAIKLEMKKVDEEFNFNRFNSITSEETTEMFYSYFSYKNFKKITDLYESNKFKRDSYRFDYFMKFDIQNFFPSIYTHSLAWAIMGDKAIAKRYINTQYNNTFGNASDKVLQKINFNETNGIVVGPEFSRVLSEVLLTRIDIELLNVLDERGIRFGRDYKIYRFIDDFLVFFNRTSDSEILKIELEKLLHEYNLQLNTSKTELQRKPIQISDGAIIKLKFIIDTYTINDSDNEYVFRSKVKKLRENVEILISEYPESTSKILNYFLKYIRKKIKFEHEITSLSNLFEVITNIFSLNINYHSTHNLLAAFAMFNQKMRTIELNKPIVKSDSIKIDKMRERIFQYLFTLLKYNKKDFHLMYDILVFMKVLPKKISSDILSELLVNYKQDYFVLCTIAYYILDDDLQTIQLGYKTLEKKLKFVISSYIKDYVSKGVDNDFFDSGYFYILNDFSHYPGFGVDFKKMIKDELIKNSSFKSSNSLSNRERELNELILKVTESSYYDWEKNSDYFIKEIAKKSSNILNRRKSY